ncbi:hypothetical protein K1719_028771 [Acacia pycnantha]|nr:hypothetical protein K1719_028771 [Acacia pycnantha]
MQLVEVENIPLVKGGLWIVGSRSWRNIEVFDLGGLTITGQPAGFTVNGAIFWIGYKRDIDGGCGCVTVSFDIANEEFSLIPVPDVDVDQDLRNGVNFTEFEHRLTILFPTMIENPESCLIELWMLEEGTCGSGERWSWAKKFVFSPVYLHPITIWRNEIVGICDLLPEEEGPELVERIVLSNLTGTVLRAISDRGYSIFNYVESLVPVRNIQIDKS